MRKNMWLTMMGSSFLALALAGTAGAETVYRWTAADGSLSFSDSAKRIPAQYRSQAQRSQTGDLANYERYTPTKGSSARYQERLAERLERLREINGTGGVAAASNAGRSGTQTILQLDNRTSIAVPNDRLDGDAPIVVEERRVRDRNNISTTHVTVVRQGDRILSVVRPESAHDRADWGSEEDLLRGTTID